MNILTDMAIQVNNAGQLIIKPTVECTAEDYSSLMATNLESCFHLSQLAHPLLRNTAAVSSTGGGSIVHISSITGSIGFPAFALYSTTKGTLGFICLIQFSTVFFSYITT
jgi:Tropinone reductase 1